MALTTNLVAYWKLDGNSNDSVGSNNGTDTSITYNTGNGKINSGAGLNGTSSLIDVGASTVLKFTGAFSLSMWVKPNATQTRFTPLFYKPTDFANGNEAYYFGFWTASSLKITLGITSSGLVDHSTVSSTALTSGVFSHLVGVYDGTNLIIYINGVADVTTNVGAVTIAYSGDFDAYIGQEKSTRFYNGAIDEVGAWSRALTSTEVTQLYNAGAGIQYPFVSNANPAFLLNFI